MRASRPLKNVATSPNCMVKLESAASCTNLLCCSSPVAAPPAAMLASDACSIRPMRSASAPRCSLSMSADSLIAPSRRSSAMSVASEKPSAAAQIEAMPSDASQPSADQPLALAGLGSGWSLGVHAVGRVCSSR